MSLAHARCNLSGQSSSAQCAEDLQAARKQPVLTAAPLPHWLVSQHCNAKSDMTSPQRLTVFAAYTLSPLARTLSWKPQGVGRPLGRFRASRPL